MTHVHTCNVIYSYAKKETCVYQPRARHPPICVTWLTFICATWHTHMRYMTRNPDSCATYEFRFMCDTWIWIHVRHDTFICETGNLFVSTKSPAPLRPEPPSPPPPCPRFARTQSIASCTPCPHMAEVGWMNIEYMCVCVCVRVCARTGKPVVLLVFVWCVCYCV